MENREGGMLRLREKEMKGKRRKEMDGMHCGGKGIGSKHGEKEREVK